MASCAVLAARLSYLQNLFRHVHDPDAQAEIAQQISDVEAEQTRLGCLRANPNPWAVLLCKFKDDPPNDPGDPPTPIEVFQKFFTPEGAGTFNAVRFFGEMSHGSRDLRGSQIFQITIDINKSYFVNNVDFNNKIRIARKAAESQSTYRPADFYADVVTFNVAIGGSFGGEVDGRPYAFGDHRYVQNNGTEAFGQEMGHGYGLDHSRRDGSDQDYQDPWDGMSTANAFFFSPDPDFGARGPGFNAWNMRGRGWLDEARVWRGPSLVFDQVIQLRPLHRRDLSGPLAAELPPNNGEAGHGRYLVEFRLKKDWDAGIPRSAVLVHRFEGPLGQFLGTHSYIMSGTNGQQELVDGGVFTAWNGGGPRLEVQKIDDAAEVATVRLSYAPPMTDTAPAVASVGDYVFFFARSLDGRVLFQRAKLGQGGETWFEVNGNGRTNAAPAAAAVGTHIFVAVKGLDGNLYLNQADLGHPFGQWFPMNFNTDAAPAVASAGDFVLFFAKSPDGRIFFQRAQLGRGGEGWGEVNGDGRTDAAPAAAAVGTHIFVAVKGLDGNLYLNQADLGHPFGQWFPMDFNTDAAPAVASAGDYVLFFAKSPEGRIFFQRAQLGQGGEGWG